MRKSNIKGNFMSGKPYEAPRVEVVKLSMLETLLVGVSIQGNVKEWESAEDEELDPLR